MDEIVLDDKKYLSSKAAAKVTGYAKDYIGQLCREGRVPARLVGRSWYVLESALKDHRFGDRKDKEEDAEQGETYSRYEADVAESIQIAIEEDPVEPEAEEEKDERVEEQGSTLPIQEAWEAWFDRVALTAAPSTEEPQDAESAEQEIPIKAIHHRPLEATRQNQGQERASLRAPEPSRRRRKSSSALSIVIFSIAGLFVILSFANSGYFDEKLISGKRDNIFLGITSYKNVR